MSRYYNDINYHQNQHHRYHKLIRKLKRLLVGVVAIGGLLVLAFGIDYVWESVRQDGQRTTTTPTKSYYTAPLKIFRTPFFQFQTDDSWSEVVSETQPNVFVYRKLRHRFVEHELFIYVNSSTAAATPSTRVLPVNATSTGELLPLKVSGNCADSYKPEEIKAVKMIQMEDVSFVCNPNDSTYQVMVGLKGGGSEIKLQRPDKTEATYTVIYRNITALPEGSQIEQIMETFQTR